MAAAPEGVEAAAGLLASSRIQGASSKVHAAAGRRQAALLGTKMVAVVVVVVAVGVAVVGSSPRAGRGRAAESESF